MHAAMNLPALLSFAGVQAACALLHAEDAQTLQEQVALARIPSPSLQEAARAAYVRERFMQLGLVEVEVDEVGNVSGRLPAIDAPQTRAFAPVLVSAHLDTVFPIDTDLTVEEREGRIYAPGIADNARGLAALLALVRVLVRCAVRTRAPLVFVATVGEEGTGNLLGAKHLFRGGSPYRSAAAFISLDGPGLRRVVHRAVGSRRVRIAMLGPGGHSWADWGIPNPISAAAAMVAELNLMELPAHPRTTLSATRIFGGTSINSIASEAWVDLDLRSEGGDVLAELGKHIEDAAQRAAQQINSRRREGTPSLRVELTHLGDRPAGATPASTPLVQAALDATRALGTRPTLLASSTDANVAISLGIPAITLGAGGEAGGIHTTGEWYSNTDGPRGIERALLTVLSVAGVDEPALPSE
jgi:tripeptide aminopeptidase